MKHIKFIGTVGIAAMLAALMMVAGCKKAEVTVSGIKISSNAETVKTGSTVQLSYTVEPTDAKVESAAWTSSAETVATVDPNGLVKGIAEGTATITIIVNGKFTATCAVTVEKNTSAMTGVKISSEADTIKVGSTVQLSYTVEPTGAKVESAAWTSSAETVATVDQNGLVKGIAEGTATITVTVNGQFTDICAVKVEKGAFVINVPSGVSTWDNTLKIDANADIIFNIGGTSYGYRKMTGNGGVGEVPLDHNGFCATPIANLQGLTTPYTMNSSQGYLEPMTSADAKELWSRMDKDKNVYVKLDLTDPANIIYYIQIVPDEGVYLDYDCSLLTCGGYYRAGNVKGPAYGSAATADPTIVTGLEPMTADVCTYTGVGTDVMTTSDVTKDEVEFYINDTYLANKRLTGWSFKRVSEKGNGIRLGRGDKTHVDCFIKTPAISSIAAGTDLYVEVTFNRYGSNMAGNVYLTTEGTGSITAAQYWTNKSTTPVEGAAKLSGGVFTIDTDVAAIVQNSDTDKPLTTVKLTVTGADSSTRIKLYVPEDVVTTQARLGVHGFKIYKK